MSKRSRYTSAGHGSRRSRNYTSGRKARYHKPHSKASSRPSKGYCAGTGYVDLPEDLYVMADTTTIDLITIVPQGAATSERVGKRIALKSLQMRGQIHASSTSGVKWNVGAYMIVYDRRPTGNLPSVTDILSGAASPNSFNNDDNTSRFRILKRVDVTIAGNLLNDNNADMLQDASFYLPLKGLPVVFKNAGTGAIGDIEVGALYLVTTGEPAGGTNGNPYLSAAFRTRYTDVCG